MKLIKIVAKRHKRQGQGGGSGKGFHTSGRGQKGQKSRTKVNVLFEGYKVKKSLLRRLPMQRGRARFKPQSTKFVVINLDALNLMPENSEVTIESLVKNGIVIEKEAKMYGVKILGGGKLTKKLSVHLPISKAASLQVTKLGGKII
jgi:large subunit ribosomal protein L15